MDYVLDLASFWKKKVIIELNQVLGRHNNQKRHHPKMTTHMKPSAKYENQAIVNIKRNEPLKRHSDIGIVKIPKKSKKRIDQYENIENDYPQMNVPVGYENIENDYSQMKNTIRYVPTRREVDSLVIDNYLFQRVSASTNKDGSIGWRCKEYRRNTKCQSTCRIGPNGEIIRRPGPHNHPCVSDAALVFMKAKADAKKRCRSENNVPIQNIFLEEMGKALISSGISLTPEDLDILPRFEANKRCLQIQRKIGATRISMSADDNLSTTSSDDASVKSDNHTSISDFKENCEISLENSSESKIENITNSKYSETPSSDSSSNLISTDNVKVNTSNKRKKKGIDSIVSGLWTRK